MSKNWNDPWVRATSGISELCRDVNRIDRDLRDKDSRLDKLESSVNERLDELESSVNERLDELESSVNELRRAIVALCKNLGYSGMK